MVSGAVERTAPAPARPLSLRRIFRSLGSKLVLLMIVFLAVPVILYNEFRQADEEQQTLLMESVREQGRLIAQSLRPLLERQGPSPLLNLNEEVSRFAAPQTGVKVLYRPAGEVVLPWRQDEPAPGPGIVYRM